MRRLAAREESYIPTSPDTGTPTNLWDVGYQAFRHYSTDDTRELSLLEMVPTLKDNIITKILLGEDYQEAFESVLTDAGAPEGEFEEVRRRVFISLPTEVQELISN